MKIGIDVDGVILDYMVTVRAYAEMYDYCDLHKRGVINREAMKVKDRYDWTKEESKQFADKYFVPLTKKTPFNPLAVEVLKKLKSEGYKLYVISNRGILHKEAATVVEEMFSDVGLEFDGLFWNIEDKIPVCLDNNISIMIDDSPTICEEAASNNIVALYFREKNSKKLPLSDKLFDIDNWGEAYRHITDLKNSIDAEQNI